MLKAATGAIRVISASQIRDGQRIVINDGIHAAITFEIDLNGSFSSGTVQVLTTPADGENVVSSDIATAIDGQGASLSITTQYLGGTAVDLVHDVRGSVGNQVITTTAPSTALTVAGMGSGAGSLCASGVGCLQSSDCAPGLVCRADKKCGL
jgi:hypothetical protein